MYASSYKTTYLKVGWFRTLISVLDPTATSCDPITYKLANNAYFYYMHDTQRYDTIAYFTHTVILTSWNIFHPENGLKFSRCGGVM